MSGTNAVTMVGVTAAVAVIAASSPGCRCERLETDAGTIYLQTWGFGLGSGSCCDAGHARFADAGVALPRSALDGPKPFGGHPLPAPRGGSENTLGAAINAALDAGSDDARGTGKKYE